jgi:hypothetical protein
MRITARAVEGRVNADRSDYGGAWLPCPCGAQARYGGRRSKSFTTALGELTLMRAYYHCESCDSGFFPRDRALGMEEVSLSPAVTRMTGLTAALVSFKESAELLEQLAGVRVNTKQVERTAEALGREIAEDERQYVEPAEDSEIPPTLYLGMDGTGVPMRRSELVDRQGKQPDGSAKTREVKLCTVWSAEGRDKEGVAVRDEGSITYSAAIESAATRDTDEVPSEFAQRVTREATRRGFNRAKRQAVLGDAAGWIWNLSAEQFPEAIQILDRFHAEEYLSNVSKAIFGAGSDLAKAWAKQRHDELDEGRIDDLFCAIQPHSSTCELARKCCGYITENRHRMRYPEFHAQGLCTSTGVVEAGCKLAIGTRIKRAGMHWTVRGADAIIALRCTKLSGRFEDFWERRAERAMARCAKRTIAA